MGLALSSFNKLSEAIFYYRKALELDPDNKTYKSNLKITEQKMKEALSPIGSTEGFDLAGLLNNPSFMNMVSNLMNNPQVQQLMSGMISSSQSPMATPGASTAPHDLASLIQMQQQNPELIEQLCSQIQSWTPNTSNEEQLE
ncbi:putative Small glutamine-rich tetratricopeptide repeat-containing protein [Naja naja]|nr:putative Small glutamine-rich tetratricopeptide repeat-containing protein [Naja naja]